MTNSNMKIKFDTLDYQTEAVNAAVLVFEGQTIKNQISPLRMRHRKERYLPMMELVLVIE